MIEKPKCFGNIYDSGGQAGNIYDNNKCAPCIPGFGAGGGGKEMKFIEYKAIDEQNMKVRDKTFGTIQTDGSSPKHNNRVLEENSMEIQRGGQISNDGSQYGTIAATDSVDNYKIRKLTPREVFRLMDFTDEQFEAAEEVSSNTALYKAAGNSLIVNVLVGILGQMIEGREDYYKEWVKETSKN